MNEHYNIHNEHYNIQYIKIFIYYRGDIEGTWKLCKHSTLNIILENQFTQYIINLNCYFNNLDQMFNFEYILISQKTHRIY